MLGAEPDSPVEVRCGGVGMMLGTMGRSGNQVAIRVDKTLKQLGD